MRASWVCADLIRSGVLAVHESSLATTCGFRRSHDVSFAKLFSSSMLALLAFLAAIASKRVVSVLQIASCAAAVSAWLAQAMPGCRGTHRG